MSYIVKKPTHGRATWSIVEKSGSTFRTVQSPILDQINRLYRAGTQSFEELNPQVYALKKLLESRTEDASNQISQENLAILGDFNSPAPGTFWKEVYGRRKRLIARGTAYHKLRRALVAIGSLPLSDASEDDLQEAIDSKGFSDDVQRAIVSSLTRLLKFVGRASVKLEKAKPEFREVKFLSEEDYKKVREHVKDPTIRLCADVAFYTGCRLGEIFALENCTDKTVDVRYQIDYCGIKRPIKTRDYYRRAYVLPGGLQYVKDWLTLPASEKARIRKVKFAEVVTEACKAVFTEPAKQVRFHDLRHSYAIYLAERGVPLSFIAKSLGNGEAVCERHYAGKVLTDGFIEAMAGIVGEKPTA